MWLITAAVESHLVVGGLHSGAARLLRFVLIDNSELSVPDIRWALIAHLLAQVP
jgi:hypothetical protein